MNKSNKDKETPSIEWDSNKSSSNCVLCNTQWGTFRNRRHHCRNCGRLVCESCSSHRFKLGNENSTELPQRVCDTCYDILKQKREIKLQVVQLKDKNLELMLSTSLISDSLINLFYLDGSTKTVGIDETTTISELAILACPNMNIALFEVIQNIQDVSQYKLLLPNQNIVALIDKWNQTGQPYIKVIIPLSNPTILSTTSIDSYDIDSRSSVMYDNTVGRGSMIAGSSGSSSLPTSPLPSAKSIFKVKQSPIVTNPIYLSSSAELMGSSYGSNRSTTEASTSLRKTPPGSPLCRQTSATSQQKLVAHSNDDISSRNSSFSDTPSTDINRIHNGTGIMGMSNISINLNNNNTTGSGSNSSIINKNERLSAELVANQVQIHSLQVYYIYIYYKTHSFTRITMGFIRFYIHNYYKTHSTSRNKGFIRIYTIFLN